MSSGIGTKFLKFGTRTIKIYAILILTKILHEVNTNSQQKSAVNHDNLRQTVSKSIMAYFNTFYIKNQQQSDIYNKLFMNFVINYNK